MARDTEDIISSQWFPAVPQGNQTHDIDSTLQGFIENASKPNILWSQINFKAALFTICPQRWKKSSNK